MYERNKHAASKTGSYIFNQLIPYIGNKRKLLQLIDKAIKHTGISAENGVFLDLFSGSGVVARLAKSAGFRVVANDWEPYAKVINTCAIALNAPPAYPNGKTYSEIIEDLNALQETEGWVARHLCPKNDDLFDKDRERLFYTRMNGMRIDAIRERIQIWLDENYINDEQASALLAPLLYQACYTSNTSGVFKGFHNGWGGQTGTALYRIKSRLTLAPAVFLDNGKRNELFCRDAGELARSYKTEQNAIAYIDPPYNQHPYGANYHVLNSIALWDKPSLPPTIGKNNKAAIRTDWRTERRSKFNYRDEASSAFEELMDSVRADWILTSYSTDGNIPLERLVNTASRAGATAVLTQSYKRYRVSRQRFSKKPLNVEFVLITKRGAKRGDSAESIVAHIREQEAEALNERERVDA